MGIEPTSSAWKAEVLPLNYTRLNPKTRSQVRSHRPGTVFQKIVLVEGGGFEPPKAEPSDLQSDPFGRSGTPPQNASCVFCGTGDPCQPWSSANRQPARGRAVKCVVGSRVPRPRRMTLRPGSGMVAAPSPARAEPVCNSGNDNESHDLRLGLRRPGDGGLPRAGGQPGAVRGHRSGQDRPAQQRRGADFRARPGRHGARNAAQGRLGFSTDLAAGVAHGLFQFIAVGTPPDEDGSADLQHVLAVARTIGEHIPDYRIVINKSTVPVGTADKVRGALQEAMAARGADISFDVVSNPEFLKEGDAVNDFMRPARIVIGAESTQRGMAASPVCALQPQP